MAKCEICGKAPMFGHKVSHSNRATNRQFRPNIQHRRIQVNGAWRHIYVCTRCLRTLSRGEK